MWSPTSLCHGGQVYNVSSSSAGAGSGDFHQYRIVSTAVAPAITLLVYGLLGTRYRSGGHLRQLPAPLRPTACPCVSCLARHRVLATGTDGSLFTGCGWVLSHGQWQRHSAANNHPSSAPAKRLRLQVRRAEQDRVRQLEADFARKQQEEEFKVCGLWNPACVYRDIAFGGLPKR